MSYELLNTITNDYRRQLLVAISTCGVILATTLCGCSGDTREDVIETEPTVVKPPKAVE